MATWQTKLMDRERQRKAVLNRKVVAPTRKVVNGFVVAVTAPKAEMEHKRALPRVAGWKPRRLHAAAGVMSAGAREAVVVRDAKFAELVAAVSGF